ncbi:hypothetical protein FA15DRAFT_39014 [Coprinopsis marcescibilis]|uniref:CBM1 domain-containing protein n=1 Tax=Coprinopsis marcescibilis TaxID=230819 RepID=A0A5C3LDS2_COPMA|nr:hypothetical protein FA15DRAFT_39014 [Coprinopsis marcescibilis]
MKSIVISLSLASAAVAQVVNGLSYIAAPTVNLAASVPQITEAPAMSWDVFQSGGYKELTCGYGHRKEADGSCLPESWYNAQQHPGCYGTTIININKGQCAHVPTVTVVHTVHETVTKVVPTTVVQHLTETRLSTATASVTHTEVFTSVHVVPTTRIWTSTEIVDRTKTVQHVLTATESVTKTDTLVKTKTDTATSTLKLVETDTVTKTALSTIIIPTTSVKIWVSTDIIDRVSLAPGRTWICSLTLL